MNSRTGKYQKLPPHDGERRQKKYRKALAAAGLAGILALSLVLPAGGGTRVLAADPGGAPAEGETQLPEQKIGSGWAAASGEAAGMGYTYLVMENSRLAFYTNEDGNIGIYDKVSEVWFTSVPTQEARDADEVAKAVNKVNLGSDYQLTFIDQNGATSVKNTLAGAVNDGNVRLEDTGDGLKVWYYIEDAAVTFSALYRLTEDGFSVTIPFEDFREHIEEGRVAEDKTTVSYWGIKDIHVLPYFGAAGLEDEGYMLIPDGSGALIEFNNQKSSYGAYGQDVYGRDPVLLLDKSLKSVKNVLMPVFGMSFGDHGFLAVAEQGGASTAINAMNSGTITSYNNVYMTFRYRQSMSASRTVANGYGGNGGLGSTVVVDNAYSGGSYRLSYHLLDAENSDYIGMARRYRAYLIEQGMEKKDAASEASLYLTLYGGIEDTACFLGVPYKRVEKLTSYEEAERILRQLKEGGAENLTVRYMGWQEDGLEASVPVKVKYEKALGGKGDYQSLMEYADREEIRIFPDVDFLNFYQSGAYSVNGDAIQAATHDTAYQYLYDLNTGSKMTENRWQMLTPNCSLEAFGRLMNQKDKLYTDNISLGAVGSTLYSDFTARSNAIHRDDTMALWSEMVRDAGESMDRVMVETGNIYAAMYADYIANVTSESTGFNLADESIPFYQIVMHGYASYGTEPINLTADPDRALLKALETGSNPGVALICGDSRTLADTRYNDLYNAKFESWEDTMTAYYQEAIPILSAVAGYEITGYERIGERAYRTDYGAGGSVYVNYGKKEVQADGVTVGAGSYVYLEGERR